MHKYDSNEELVTKPLFCLAVHLGLCMANDPEQETSLAALVSV
jgi:hypothetical protein